MSTFTDLAAEGILLAGGGRAILLQIANPKVGYGVAAHSAFSTRPTARLVNTVTYAYSTVFATPDELEEVVGRVNRAHAPVRSGLAGSPESAVVPASASYSAFDPNDQLWVAATLYQTATTVYEKTFGALSPSDAEDVYQRYAVLGSALQMSAELWPADVAAFGTYWSAAVARLDVTDAARQVAQDLLYPRTAPLWLRLAMPTARLLTVGLLDDDLRRQFVLAWSTRSQRRFDRLFGILAVVYPRLPRRLRHLPRDYFLRELRKSLQT